MNISYKQRLLNIEEKGILDDQRESIGWSESGYLVGEFAFPYMEDFEWDDLLEYITDELEAVDKDGVLFDSIHFNQLSSKSGVFVYLTLDTEEFNYLYVDSSSSQEEMSEDRDAIIEAYQRWKEEWKVYEKLMARAEELVRQCAIGERCGIFSNGEVIFSPINKDKTGYTQDFTPYYNPNN